MTRTIAICNQKGGVGKTNTVANLGAALAGMGERTLLVDLDPRGDLTSSFGLDASALQATVYEAMFDEAVSLRDASVLLPLDNLALVAANTDLAAGELLLLQRKQGERERVLAALLQEVSPDVAIVLIDTPPGLQLLTINALVAAREVLVPQQCSFLSLHGLKQLQRTIDGVRESLNPDLRMCGIVATMLDKRTVHHREVINLMRGAFGDVVFDTAVPASIRFQEAPAAGMPVIHYAPKSAGALAYQALAKEVLDRGKAS
jgi:chromosome partitioning protein